MLAVPDHLVMPLASELQRVRRDQNFFHEVHFKSISGIRVEDSPAWRTANSWLRAFFEHMLAEVRFKAFVVDLYHDNFDRERYPSETAAYRRFAITVAKSLVAWSLRGEGEVQLTPLTDDGNASARKIRRDGDLFDKFHVYVQRECEREKLDNKKKFYPHVTFSHPLRAIPSSPKAVTDELAATLGIPTSQLAAYSELIQLSDLLCGCVAACLSFRASGDGKIRLAETFARELATTYRLPWYRAVRRARAMSVSLFPGATRTPYAISLEGVQRAGLHVLSADVELRAYFSSRYGYHPDRVPDEQLRFPTEGT